MDNSANHTHRGRLQDLINGWPIVQFVGAAVIGLSAAWTTVQVSAVSQAAENRRADERIRKLEAEAVPRELFDERTKMIIDELRYLREETKRK